MRGIGAFQPSLQNPDDRPEPMIGGAFVPMPYADSPDGGGPVFQYSPMMDEHSPASGNNWMHDPSNDLMPAPYAPARKSLPWVAPPDPSEFQGSQANNLERLVTPPKVYHDNTGSESWMHGIDRAMTPGDPVMRDINPDIAHPNIKNRTEHPLMYDFMRPRKKEI